MGIKILQPSNKSTNSIADFRTKKFKEYSLSDPDISQQPFVIIENNLEVIEELQNLLNKILEISNGGLKVESLNDKHKALQNIKDMITQSSDED